MKKYILIFLLPLFALQLLAQGIEFQHLTFDEAVAKAKQENKLVFIDFYTDWCVPCKALAKNVFTDAEVGKLYNQEFINIKLNAEKEGLKEAKKFEVNAYPSLIFVDGDGNMSYKKTGLISIEKTLEMAKEALESVTNGYSQAKLKELFPQKQNDEKFLKIYFTKMIEYGANPTEGIEAWLKVQKEIKESDVDMMEFILKYGEYFYINSKAEEILDANMTEYLDIATKKEALKLSQIKAKMLSNTMTLAYSTQNPELLMSLINRVKSTKDEKYIPSLKNFELDYIYFKKDYENYKVQTAIYLDSLIKSKTLDQIRTEDKATYENYKNTQYAPSLMGNATLASLEKGKEAGHQTRMIQKYGTNYLKHTKSRKEYKNLKRWVEYGSKLIPDDYSMDNLWAEVLYKQGDVKKAIVFKESALKKLDPKDKKTILLKRDLEKFKNGKTVK